MSWLFEGSSTVYLILGILALALAVGWWMNRKRAFLIGLAVVAGFAGVYWLLDVLVVTDREQMVLNLKDMAQGVKDRNTDQVFGHISHDFRSPQGKTKEEFRQISQTDINSGEVQEILMWDFNVTQVDRGQKTGTVAFSVKARGNSGEYGPFDCEAHFHLDPDNQWRLVGFKLFFPQTTREVELPF
ncbi:MAG: hypothetical protein JO112_14985 [Planctomycetes bacterium]|nr:hypothetical protein [Planctomycetota bacterium]